MKLKSSRYLPILVLIAVVFLSGCTGQSPGESGEVSTEQKIPVEAVIEPEQEEAPPEVKEFTITARQWEFEPNTITVNSGDKVRLSITSVDVTHGFGVPDLGINVRLEPGKTEVVEFTAGKPGRYSFLCTVACGPGHGGMIGQIVVK